MGGAKSYDQSAYNSANTANGGYEQAAQGGAITTQNTWNGGFSRNGTLNLDSSP